MRSIICPKCGGKKWPGSNQCWECSKQSRSLKLRGVRHDEERVRNIKAGVHRSRAAGIGREDPGSHTRGKPSPFSVPPGTERVRESDGRVSVKCQDGKWRWRARVIWEETFGFIGRGCIIHHIDEDPSNDDFWNLMRVTRAEHAAIHMTARKRQKVSAIKRIQNRNQ